MGYLKHTKMLGKGRYGHLVRFVIVAIEFILLNAVYLSVCCIDNNANFFYSKLLWLLVNISYIPVVYIFSNIHDKRILYVDRVVVNAIQAIGVHVMVFMSLVSFLGLEEKPMRVYFEFYSVLFSVIVIWWVLSRKLLKAYRRRGFNFKRIIIVGAGKTGLRLLEEIKSDAGYGYHFMGFFDDNKRQGKSVVNYQGCLADIEQFVMDNNIDEIYCTLSGDDERTLKRLISISESCAVVFYLVPDIGRYVHMRFDYSSLGTVPTLAIRKNPLQNVFNKTLKRTFDIVFSGILMLLSPLVYIPVALAIKISSPGPVFFKQKRTGLKGHDFWCYKFRTMKVNADSDTLQATKGDSRITHVGEFLRKTSIDELPQFLNVLKGDMSVVGPRPHMVTHTIEYSALIDKYMVRHTIKPGITGWAQVLGFRGETKELWQMEKRVAADVWYMENWNFWLDIKIIIRTVINAIIGERNAY